MIEILIILNICHLLADFTPLSTPWMLSAKRYGKPFLPIALHANMHAVLMFFALLFFVKFQIAGGCALIQLISHFAIDVCKGRLQGRFYNVGDNSKRLYWLVFGLDQFLHQVIIIFITAIAVASTMGN